MKKYIKLMRVKHWIKNGLIFLPFFFNGDFDDIRKFLETCIGFFVFSIAASIVYIINDMNDIESDRQHPIKCKRPLASEEISIIGAKKLLALLGGIVLFLNWFVAKDNIVIWLLLFAYLVINIIYSFGGKKIALLDIALLVTGYVIRIYYGAEIISVIVSSWLYLTVLFMAFFLGLGKRRNEIIMQGSKSRSVLQYYTKEFLDKNMYMCLGLTIMFYSLWCEEIHRFKTNGNIMFTIPLVVIICMKYSLNIEKEVDGDPLETLLSDKMLMILIATYVIVISALLWW